MLCVYCAIIVFFCYWCTRCVPSVLWYCWLGLLTCKNRLPYNLYCVGGDVKHCSLTHYKGTPYTSRLKMVWVCCAVRWKVQVFLKCVVHRTALRDVKLNVMGEGIPVICLLVHLILRISPYHGHHLHSYHLEPVLNKVGTGVRLF